VEEEISDLNQSNLLTKNCSSDKIRVCFGSSSCNVNVDYNAGTVEKKGDIMYFVETGENSRVLMYAAIFSNKEVYECQLSRLMLRTKEISSLYKDKESLTGKIGCDTNLGNDFNEFIDMISNFSSSEELGTMKMKVDDIDGINRARMCMLW
jgi:hypothetical protein